MIIVAAVCLLHELHGLYVLKHELIFGFEQTNHTTFLFVETWYEKWTTTFSHQYSVFSEAETYLWIRQPCSIDPKFSVLEILNSDMVFYVWNCNRLVLSCSAVFGWQSKTIITRMGIAQCGRLVYLGRPGHIPDIGPYLYTVRMFEFQILHQQKTW